MKFENGVMDNFVRQCWKKSPSTSISFFLICSYAYYIKYESLLSDTVFDKLCAWMLANWDSLEHVNKHLVTKEMLAAGSGYNLKESDYPLRVRLVADEMIREYYKHRDGKG